MEFFPLDRDLRADEVVVVGDGTIRHRGSAEDILPKILADTLSGCPVLSKEVQAR